MQLSRMIPAVNIIDGKVSIASVNEACGSGGVLRPQQCLRRQSPLGKFLAAKWHLDWLKIDLKAAEITIYCSILQTQKLISMEILRAKQVSELVSKAAEQAKKIFRL